MPRIAFIAGTYHPQRCGVAHYTAHLQQCLHERGFETVVLTTRAAAESVGESGVVGAVDRWHLSELPRLVQAIHASGADLLHIQHAAGTYQFDRSLFLLPLLLRISGWQQSIITTIHEYGWWEWQPKLIPAGLLEGLKVWGQQHGWWDREDGFLLTMSDRIITTNSDASRVVCERLPRLASILHQIQIGANVQASVTHQFESHQHLRMRCGWPPDAKVFAFFGFLHPVKGIETLIQSFQKVVQSHPEARLVLVGGVESLALPRAEADQYWNRLQQLIQDNGLGMFVHMTGYLSPEEVSQCLAGADIGVLPFNHGVTLKSGSLLALFAHRLPVIATRATPPDPELEQPQLLTLVPPKNAVSLAEEMVSLLENLSLQKELGMAGYQFGQQFSWAGIGDRHQELYISLLTRQNCEERAIATHQRKLRVVVYTDAEGLGGAEISLRHLVERVSQRVELTIVGVSSQIVETIGGSRNFGGTADSGSNVPQIVLPVKGSLAWIKHWQTFRRLRPDIIHFNLCTPWACAIAQSAALTLPDVRVVRVDQLPLRTTDARTLWRTRALALRVDAHVAVGEASARKMEDFYALGRHSVISIPNGVPDMTIEPIAIPMNFDAEMTVASVGRLSAMKAHDILLRAIAKVEDVNLVLIGDGEEREPLVRLAEELGVSDRFHVLGWVAHPQAYLPNVDVVALPSRSEGFPLAMVEAMLAARPVVATRVGSMPEAVIHGETGLLIEKNDVPGLVNALTRLRDDPLLRSHLGKQAREMALAQFTADAMVASYERLWNELVAVPAKPRLKVGPLQD